jgi:hypothetical protein
MGGGGGAAGSGQSGIDAGSSGSGNSNGDAGTSGGVNDAGSTQPTTDQTCAACVETSAKTGTCANAIKACKANIAPDGCAAFMSAYASCAAQIDGQAQCMLNAANNVSADAQVAFMSGVLRCVSSTCSSLCVENDAQDCMSCEKKSCPDVYDSYLTDADAQKLMWCRRAAKGVASELQKCNKTYSAGMGVLAAAAQCAQNSCNQCN